MFLMNSRVELPLDISPSLLHLEYEYVKESKRERKGNNNATHTIPSKKLSWKMTKVSDHSNQFRQFSCNKTSTNETNIETIKTRPL